MTMTKCVSALLLSVAVVSYARFLYRCYRAERREVDRILRAYAFVRYEELAECFIQMAAALEQGIIEKAEKHTTGGWAFRTFTAR